MSGPVLKASSASFIPSNTQWNLSQVKNDSVGDLRTNLLTVLKNQEIQSNKELMDILKEKLTSLENIPLSKDLNKTDQIFYNHVQMLTASEKTRNYAIKQLIKNSSEVASNKQSNISSFKDQENVSNSKKNELMPDWKAAPSYKDLKKNTNPLKCLCVLDNKKLVSGSEGGSINLWDSDGNFIQSLEGHTETILSIFELVRNKMLVTSSFDNTMRFWKGGEEYHCICSLEENFTTGNFIELQNGKLAYKDVFGHDIVIMNLKDFSRQILKGNSHISNFIEFQEGIASASDDGFIKFWDTEGKLIHSLEAHGDGNQKSIHLGGGVYVSFSDGSTIHCLVEFQDGMLVSSASDRTIKLWNLKDGSLQTITDELDNPAEIIVELDKDTFAAALKGGRIKKWNRHSGKCIQILEGHSDDITCLKKLSDGKLASLSKDGTIKIWDHEGNCIQTLRGIHNKNGDFVEWKKGVIVAGSMDNTVRVWEFPLV